MNSAIILDIDVLILTYNQEATVAMAIDSILAQRTKHNLRIYINDDNSTDSTPLILKQYESLYPNLIRLQLNGSNLGIPHNYYNIFQRSDGDLVFCCAGDDYWCDDAKVEKMVEYLLKNKEVDMVYSNIDKYDLQKDKHYYTSYVTSPSYYDLFHMNIIPAVSVCYRRRAAEEFYSRHWDFIKEFNVEDYPLWLWISSYSNIGFIEDVTSVYVVHSSSVSHTCDYKKSLKYTSGILSILDFFHNKIKPMPGFVSEYKRSRELCRLALLYNNYTDYCKFFNPNAGFSIIYRVAKLCPLTFRIVRFFRFRLFMG